MAGRWLIRALLSLAAVCAALPADAAGFDLTPISPAAHHASSPSADLEDGQYAIAWLENGYDGPIAVATGTTDEAVRKRRITELGGPNARQPFAAVGSGGTRAVAWYSVGGRGKGQTRELFVAVASPDTRRWRTSLVATPRRVGTSPAVTVGPKGDVAVIWEETQASYRSRLYSSIAGPGQPFAKPTLLYREPTIAGIYDLHAALDRDGSLLFTWNRGSIGFGAIPFRASSDRPDIPGAAFAGVRRAAGSVRIRRLGLDCSVEPFAAADSGAAVAGMTCGTFRIYASTRAPGGEFTKGQLLSADHRDDYASDVAITGSGRVAVVWSHREQVRRHGRNRSVQRVESAFGTAGRPLGGPRVLTRFRRTQTTPRLLEGPRGAVLVAYPTRRRARLLSGLTAHGLVKPRRNVGRSLNGYVLSDGTGRALLLGTDGGTVLAGLTRLP